MRNIKESFIKRIDLSILQQFATTDTLSFTEKEEIGVFFNNAFGKLPGSQDSFENICDTRSGSLLTLRSSTDELLYVLIYRVLKLNSGIVIDRSIGATSPNSQGRGLALRASVNMVHQEVSHTTNPTFMFTRTQNPIVVSLMSRTAQELGLPGDIIPFRIPTIAEAQALEEMTILETRPGRKTVWTMQPSDKPKCIVRGAYGLFAEPDMTKNIRNSIDFSRPSVRQFRQFCEENAISLDRGDAVYTGFQIK